MLAVVAFQPFLYCCLVMRLMPRAMMRPDIKSLEGHLIRLKVIMEHIMDAHEFHFLSYRGSDSERA